MDLGTAGHTLHAPLGFDPIACRGLDDSTCRIIPLVQDVFFGGTTVAVASYD